MFAAALTLALATLAAAQSSPALQVEGIEAHFSAAGIVPSLLPSFTPSALLTLTFPGTPAAAPGQALTKDQVAAAPAVALTPANASVTLSGNYTLTMVDAGPVGTDESAGQTRHWLVNSATVASGAVSNASAVPVTDYAGPGPAAGSGPHRYVVLLYAQPAAFTPPANLSAPHTPLGVFSLTDYVSSTALGPLVAATYFTVEEGTASVSLSATSAVQSSTLAPVASGSGSGSGAAPIATSPSGSGSGSSSGALGASAPMALVLAALALVAIV